VTRSRASVLAQRAGGRLQGALWPESRAALRTPVALDPPPPHAFAAFGGGSWVVPPARVIGPELVEIGAGVILMEHCEIWAERGGSANGTGSPLVHIGDGTRFARFVTIWATTGVHIGARVSTSDYVAIVDCWRRPRASGTGPPPPAGSPVVVHDGAYLGCGSVIGPGVTVGEGAFVGEGAVVMDDVPAHAVVYGNPARLTSRWSRGAGWEGDMFGQRA
jgi:carbonic anhydrase/acetyltransferase-like protein (isoleucine patch superfamily)